MNRIDFANITDLSVTDVLIPSKRLFGSKYFLTMYKNIFGIIDGQELQT